jgi:hypothetical protein
MLVAMASIALQIGRDRRGPRAGTGSIRKNVIEWLAGKLEDSGEAER